jgi:hypothetical protein
MSNWSSISEVELHELILKSEREMSTTDQRYWESIKIVPKKWDENSNGKAGGGFWVVGVLRNKVIWYNDIEDGFNISRYSKYGTIDEYLCNQDELHDVIKWLVY